jgi:hypothetical protein
VEMFLMMLAARPPSFDAFLWWYQRWGNHCCQKMRAETEFVLPTAGSSSDVLLHASIFPCCGLDYVCLHNTSTHCLRRLIVFYWNDW